MLSSVGDYPHQGRETGIEMLLRLARQHRVPLNDLPDFAAMSAEADRKELAAAEADRKGFAGALMGLMGNRLRLDADPDPDRHLSPHFIARTNPGAKPDPEKVQFLTDLLMGRMNERLESSPI